MISTGICRWLFLLISLSTWTEHVDSKEMRIVCYYTNWSVYRPGQAKFSPQNINPYLCTHLIYAFGGFTKENTLKPFDKYQDIEKGGYAKFTGLKTYNKNLKTLIAIGGWNEGSSRFSPMVASADRRKQLVKNAIKFLRQNHFDGLDLDWEYPTFRDGGKLRDRDNYAELVKELREEFERESEKTGRPRLLLTMAVPAGIEYVNKGYDVPKLTKYLDWMNILSYDYHSAFEPAVNHHAPLYSLEEDNEYNYDAELNIDYTIKHYLKLGADPNKLVLGIPTYGRSYTLFNPEAYEIGAPADGPGDMGEATRENGYLAYYEICENVKDQDWEVEEPNPKAMGPIAYKDNQWVGYDDENIVRKKAEYVAENSLGGIMFWAIDNDDFRGNCHGKPYPLIEAGKEALINAYGLTEENLISPPSKPTKSSKTKSRTRRPTKTTTTEQPEESSASSVSNRRRRIKTKSRDEDRSPSPAKRRKDSARKSGDVSTSTYSSLKIVTPAYTTPAPPATPDMGGAFKCEDEGFFPHPKDCKKYFWCLGGAGDTGIIAHQFTCPAGLYFNKGADSCDYSQNVLCNKKLQKATTSTTEKENSIESTTSPKTTPLSIFSTTRVPPKITAATSKTTVNFRTTTTTTEAYEDEYEYEDEEDEPSKKEESEEDPRVIKELIDLIKKAGGIEELEKHLKFGKDGSPSTSTSDSTTPSAISKSLYQRVLSKTAKSTLDALKKTSTNRNSGGPQGSGGEEKKDKKVDRGRPQYKTLSRQRSSTEKSVDDEPELEENVEREESKEKKFFRTKSSLEYVNIRRPKASTTTEANDDDGFSRNKILGELEDENEDEDEDEDEETEDVTKKNNIPQYVNIRRQRPSTTEASATSSKYNSIRRSTVSPLEPETDDNDQEEKKYKIIRRGSTTESSASDEPTSLRYQTIQRGTTTTPTSVTEQNDEVIRRRSTTTSPSTTSGDKTDSKYASIRRSTTTGAPVKEEIDSVAKYQTIRRESTTQSTLSTSEEPKLTQKPDKEEPTSITEIDLPDTTLSQDSISNNSTITTENIISTSTYKGTTESNSNASSTDSSTTVGSLSGTTEQEIKKKRPVLFQPRPFSVGTTTPKPTTSAPTTTLASKVSQSSFKYRLKSNTSSNSTNEPSTTIRSRTRTRTRYSNVNRNLNEDTEQEEKYDRIVENKPVRNRKRVSVSTETPIDYNEEYNRKYRPQDLADLSSLTAADLNHRGGEFVSQNRRRRPTVATSSTTTTERILDESEKTGSRTLTLARKALASSNFGKSRRVVTTTDDQLNASSDQTSTTRKIVRGFRSTTPKTAEADEPITIAEERSKPTTRTRRIIRKFRPGSLVTSSTEQPASQTALFSSTTSSSTTALLRKRVPLFRPRDNKSPLSSVINTTTSTPINATESIESSSTTPSVSESPLLRLFKTRSKFNVSKNETADSAEDDDEDELSNEHTDVLNGEEGENIKLSESNIRESSQINSFGFDEKPAKQKFGGNTKELLKQKEQEPIYGDKIETTTNSIVSTTPIELENIQPHTEPTRILRTRKIIRKLNTTSSTEPPTTISITTTDSSYDKTFGRKRKILRRLRPTSNNDLETKPDEKDNQSGQKKFIFRGRSTTESNTPFTPEQVIEEIKSRKSFRPSFGRRTTERIYVQEEKGKFEPNKFRVFRPTTDSSSESTPRYSLYTRSTYSPLDSFDVDEDDDEYLNDEDVDDEAEDDTSDDTEDEDDNRKSSEDDAPKYTIYTTSSVKRTHKFESNTNFNDEDEEDGNKNLMANKSISSHITKSALNSRNESQTILDDSNDQEEENNVNSTTAKPNNLLKPQKDRPSFIRHRLTLGKEEVKTESQKDLLKTQPGYRFRPTTTTEPTESRNTSTELEEIKTESQKDLLKTQPITTTESTESRNTSTESEEIKTQSQKDLLKTEPGYRSKLTTTTEPTESPKTFTESDSTDLIQIDISTVMPDITTIEEYVKENVSSPITETTEKIDITTLLVSAPTEDNNNIEINTILLTTTEELKETTLKHNTDEPIEVSHPDERDETTTDLDSDGVTLTSEALPTSTSSLSETTTESIQESTKSTVNNLTESTTEYRRRSTLRSINDRPRLGWTKRTTTESTNLSPGTELTVGRSNSKNTFTKTFGKSRTRKPSTKTFSKPVLPKGSRSTTPLPLNKLLYRYSTTERNRFEPKENINVDEEGDYDDDENAEDNDDEEEEEEKEAVSQSTKPIFLLRSSTTPRVVNKPVDTRKLNFKNTQNKPKFIKTTSSTTDNSQLEDLGVDTEAVKNRNKNLFSKRKMNVPILSSSTVPTTDFSSDAASETTTTSSAQIDSTDPSLTTLHHIFAEVEGDGVTTTESMSASQATNSGKVERLIEVNRIVEFNTKEAKVKNHAGEVEVATKGEFVPTVDKIGEISRITLIKIVDGNNETIIKDPEWNEIGGGVENPSVTSVPLETAKVEEIPVKIQNVNLKDFQFDIKMHNGESLAQREQRKFEIFGESKVANNKEFFNPNGKPEIIDGISHINVVTPKPLLATEASTISLQGLFQTEKPHLNPSFTSNDEMLETGRSEFVNVRLLDQDTNVRLDKGLRSKTNFIPISVLPQDEEESTIKAHVMEISPKPDSRTIKIVPIRVEMSRSLANLRLSPKQSGVKT